MSALEEMGLRELMALRAQLWEEPATVAPLIAAAAARSKKLLQGQDIVARSFATAIAKRLDDIERRLDALDREDRPKA